MPMLKPLLGALGVTLAVAAPAAAQTDPYPGTTSTTTVSATAQAAGTVAAGQTTVITSCGFRPGPVSVSLNGRGGATDTAEGDGCARTTVTVVSVDVIRVEGVRLSTTAPPTRVGVVLPALRLASNHGFCGENTLGVTGPDPAGNPRTVNTLFTVDCPAAPAGGLLPRTGATVLRWSLAGAALLAVGWLIVLADRRRRVSTAL